jgi:hypothetical protein
MSREVRRVPLDFDWPMNEVWDGYLRPRTLDDDAVVLTAGCAAVAVGAFVVTLVLRRLGW